MADFKREVLGPTHPRNARDRQPTENWSNERTCTNYQKQTKAVPQRPRFVTIKLDIVIKD